MFFHLRHGTRGIKMFSFVFVYVGIRCDLTGVRALQDITTLMYIPGFIVFNYTYLSSHNYIL